MGRVTVTPDPFTLIAYDAAEIAAIVEDVAALVGIAEQRRHPSGRRRRAVRAARGALVRRRRRPHRALDLGCQLRGQPPAAHLLARAGPPRPHDRVAAGQGPALARLRRRAARRPAHPRRAGCVGRLRRRSGRPPRLGGLPVRHQAQLYEFRLQHGFSDVADAAFERLWESPSTSFAAIQEICAETGAADRGPSKIPVDLLRQK